mmetsp:Transcript_14272/g.21131  ORF Transcript_14272/g.21131 Transcript_14272/m.21131 type:complete len:200 (-) Transcript_14272:1318-1917(-)
MTKANSSAPTLPSLSLSNMWSLSPIFASTVSMSTSSLSSMLASLFCIRCKFLSMSATDSAVSCPSASFIFSILTAACSTTCMASFDGCSAALSFPKTVSISLLNETFVSFAAASSSNCVCAVEEPSLACWRDSLRLAFIWANWAFSLLTELGLVKLSRTFSSSAVISFAFFGGSSVSFGAEIDSSFSVFSCFGVASFVF